MLSLHDVAIQIEQNRILEHVSFSLQSGEIGCLLGPSGCGKTSLLRAIAGFMRPSYGEIQINNQLVASAQQHVSVKERHIGMVFQDFALFPHLTVRENIAFGLHDFESNALQNRVDECVALVELQQHQDQYPYELSGGQQQRVALARAIAPQPSILLLDEPFSSLDTHLREQLAIDVRAILKQVNTTAVIVTHDQNEAFAMADKVAVLKDKRLQQFATPYSLYHQPSTAYVARFIGEGVFIPAQLDSNGKLRTAIGEFDSEQVRFCDGASSQSPQLKLLIRPDDIQHDDNSPFKANIVKRTFRGANILYQLSLPDTDGTLIEVLCLAPSHHDHLKGESFGITLALEHVLVFPAA